MKRIISLLISAVIISNLLGSALMTNATEMKNDQDAFVNCDALVTGNYDIGSASTNDGIVGITEGVALYPVFEKKPRLKI